MRIRTSAFGFIGILVVFLCFIAAEAVAQSTPVKGGGIVVGLNTDITAVDPHTTVAVVDANVLGHVFEPLLAYKDKYTVAIHLKEPTATFPYSLADLNPVIAIVPKEEIEKQGGVFKHPIGTGPFKFVEWVPDRYVILERYDNYKGPKGSRDGLAGERMAYLDRIKFVPVPEESVSIMALLNKEIDYLQYFPPTQVEKYRNDYSKKGLVLDVVLDTTKKYISMYRQAVAVQSELAAAGVNVKLNVLEWPVLIKKCTEGDFQMLSYGAGAMPNAAQAYSYLKRNKFDQVFPKIKEIWTAAESTTDLKTLQGLFAEAHKIQYEQVPWIELYNYNYLQAYWNYVKGYKAINTGVMRFWGVWLDK
jgi:ABC-type transport system substrate-binding protein